MKLYIDTANIEKIKTMNSLANFKGITTNPSILSKEKVENPLQHLKDIHLLLNENQEMHIQVIEKTKQEIIKNAEKIREEFGESIYIKTPLTKEGALAIKQLKKDGYNITATAVYILSQALLACNLGVDYIASYVNRIDNLSVDGVSTMKDIQTMIESNGYKTRLIAASFKNLFQVMQLALDGIYGATLPYDVFKSTFDNSQVQKAENDFIEDFNKTYKYI